MHPLRGAEYLVRDLLMPRLDEAYEDLYQAAQDADVVVSHPLTFTAPLVAEKLQRHWAASVLAPLSFFSRRDPPLVVAHPFFAGLHRRWPHLVGSTIPIGQQLTRMWVRPLRMMRRRLGLPPGGHPLYEGQFSPHLNLAMFSTVLATPQADWPPNTRVTGAVSYDAVQGGLPPALAAFLDAGPPPIVFTLGSAAVHVKGARNFYETGVAAAQSLGLRAVLLAGRDSNRPAVRSDQVFIADWAPHSELFPRANVIVHQGGAGTLHTALASGRPMIIVPFAHDQPDNASRVERLGASRTIYPQQFTVETVRHAFGDLSRKDTDARAKSIAETVRAERGAEMAATALESIGTRG